MKRQLIILSLLLFISTIVKANSDIVKANSESLSDYVDMYMGVRGISNCVIGPQLPHGSVNPSPQTPNGGQNGYDENDLIRGFGQLHVSGIGWSRYGQVFLSPQIGFSAKEDGHDSKKSGEIATPFYYKVDLDRYGITAELAPTSHAVAYRFTYPEKKDRTLLLDMRHSIPQHIVPIVKGRFLGGELEWNPETSELSGWGEYAGGFGSELPYRVYFSMTLDDPSAKVSIKDKGSDELYARIDTDRSELNVNVGVSLKSVDCARGYRHDELDGKNVDIVAQNAKNEWNSTLSKIQIDNNASENDKKLFYTALYHSLVMPRDRTGDNPHWESDQPHIDDHYCVWDTWRTVYPLLTLIEESFVSKTINSFIDRLDHDGKVTPTFTASMEWDSKQGGDDVDNIIADAIIKNVKGFDREKAYNVMLHNAFESRSPDYISLGYEPGKNRLMSCSYTMEYAYNDNCLSRMAKLMGDSLTADKMAKRSSEWEKMFNPDLESCGFKGFVAPVAVDGERIWIDATEVFGSWQDYFYEGNAWTYTLFTPADFERLIALCGGKEEMVKRLRYGFDNNLVNLSNEPGFLTPFIFSHCDRPDLAAEYVERIRKNDFSIERGYPDNEDSGAMGSWYVFTSLGLFPNAGQDIYYLLPPAFSDASIIMENGNKIVMKATKKTPDSRYISSVKLNGNDLNRWWISHEEIANGAVIEFELSDNPQEWKVEEF